MARVALGSAVSAAFVPGALLLYLLVSIVLALSRAMLDRGVKVTRGFASSVVGLAAGWALLLPWSLSWFSDGGAYDVVMGPHRDAFAASYNDHGAISALLGQLPEGPALLGLALPILGLIAVIVGEGQRRRLALGLWGLVAVAGFVSTAIATGIVPPLISHPTELGVLVSLSFAALAGLAVGAFRLDLPRRGLGLLHAATLFGMAAAVFLFSFGAAPAMWHGEWGPGRGSERAGASTTAQIRDILSVEAQQLGQFRALWVGDLWTSPQPSVARPVGAHELTGSRGQLLTELFLPHTGAGEDQLRNAIASIEDGATDRGGRLLGAFNIRFVVLARGPGAGRWLSQRDLGLIRSEIDYLLLENQAVLTRAGVYTRLPVYVGALQAEDPGLTAGNTEIERTSAEQLAVHNYRARRASGPGTVFLAESRDDGWKATIDGEDLPPIAAGWGNGFEMGPTDRGELRVYYPRTLTRTLWLIAIALAWIVVIGAAFSRRRKSLFSVGAVS